MRVGAAVLLSLLFSAHVAFADGLPTPGDPNNPVPPHEANFDSRQEGIYDVHLTCDPRPEDCNGALMEQLNRLSITNSHTPFGIWVTLAGSSPSQFIDAFYGAHVGPNPTDVTASPRPGSHVGQISYMQFSIDPVSGEVSGMLEDFRSRGRMVMHGKPIARVADLLRTPPPAVVKFDTLLGSYKGTLAGMAGTLSISKTPANLIYGYFATDQSDLGEPLFSLKFAESGWNSAAGLLQFTFQSPRAFGEGELALAVSATAPLTLQNIYFNGFAHGTGAFVKTL
jgi:hypothetical protein